MMELEIRTEVDRELSIDPSYIIRYQLFEKGRFIGDGVAQYHRLAEHNDYRIPDIKMSDGSSLHGDIRERVKNEITDTAQSFISRQLHQ